MRSAALVLTALVVALGAAVSPLAAQTKAPAPAPRSGSAPPAAAPKPRAGEIGREDRRGPRSNAPIVIDADRMEAFKKDGLVVFSGNVVAKQENSVQTADRMEVYLDDKGERVLRIILDGERQDRHRKTAARRPRSAPSTTTTTRSSSLIGDAKVWQEDNVVTGERMRDVPRRRPERGRVGTPGTGEVGVLPEARRGQAGRRTLPPPRRTRSAPALAARRAHAGWGSRRTAS